MSRENEKGYKEKFELRAACGGLRVERLAGCGETPSAALCRVSGVLAAILSRLESLSHGGLFYFASHVRAVFTAISSWGYI
jgi:hypothetical protein